MRDDNTQDGAEPSPASAGSQPVAAIVNGDEAALRIIVRQQRKEIERLKEAIRRLAEQDATLSVCDGNVTVTMDGTLTDEEWDEVEKIIDSTHKTAEFNAERLHPYKAEKLRRRAAILIGLLERLG